MIINFFSSILKIGHSIIPWSTEECFQILLNNSNDISILDYQFPQFSIKNTDEFEKIIHITKMLRKLAVKGGSKAFMISNDKENKTSH